jgi:hypothetical protein
MLWLEGRKHELNPLGVATLQRWKYRIDLMSGRRHHYEMIRGFLVQLVGDKHLGTLTRLCAMTRIREASLRSHVVLVATGFFSF